MASGPPPDRSTKRLKVEGPMGGPPHPESYHGYPPGRYQQPPYGPGGPHMGPRSGFMGWQHGQYGSHPPPPHSWPHGSPPPPGSMYPQQAGPPMTPDRGGYGQGYPRGPPPPIQAPPGGRRPGKPRPPGPPGSAASSKPPNGAPDGPPGAAYQGGAWGPSGQWSQSHQWGNGPPPSGAAGWQGGGPPPMHHPPGYAGGHPSMYGTSPPRSVQRPLRGSPEVPPMPGYPGAPPTTVVCQPIETNTDIDMYQSRGVGTGMDDECSSVAGGGGSSKDKGRGSYKCGRCGVPKKGHICPYQPKLTRRPGEPLPEMRSAAIQVEMDEFMTLRRLNLRIQGFPESYASEPYMEDDMVVGEPRHAMPSALMSDGPGMTGSPPPDIMTSPIRSSPIGDDPITGAA